MTYLVHQLTLNPSQCEIKERIMELNQNNNTKKLKDYIKNYHQKDEINIRNFSSHIDFDHHKNKFESSALFTMK